MIIPTREDEKKIIKKLMQSTEMTLGASWHVVIYIFYIAISHTIYVCTICVDI